MFLKNDWPMVVFAVVLTFILAKIILPGLLKTIGEAGFVRPNFRGDKIPVGAGLLFFLALLLPVACIVYWGSEQYSTGGLLFLLALCTMTLLGMVDDVFGSRADSGLKGHLRKLLRGELTTGGLKLIMGGLMSLLAAVIITTEWVDLLVSTLVIALSINAINLLDLRPGRAGKGYLLGLIVLVVVSWPAPELVWVLITGAALLAYLPTDLKARAMMGDTGSNALGAALGIVAAMILAWPLKLGYLGFLIVFHLFTEKYSLTKVIEKNKILNYLDHLGRS